MGCGSSTAVETAQGRGNGTNHLPRSTPASKDPPVFISFRVNEAKTEARILQGRLAVMGVGAFVSEGGIDDAEDWRRRIGGALLAAKVMVVLGTKTYGAKGSSSQGTWEELLYAKKREAPMGAMRIFVVQMCDVYEKPETELELDKYQAPRWEPGEPLPERVWQGLLSILHKAGLLEAVASGSPAAPSAAAPTPHAFHTEVRAS